MGKRLFLLLITSFIGSICHSYNLIATDSISVLQPDFNAVETVEIKKPTIEADQTVVTKPTATAVTYATTPVTPAPTPVYTAPANSINIAGKNLEIIDVASTTVDAGTHVNKYGEKFLYGHNSGAVFSNLKNLGAGSTFSVTYNGTTSNYVISRVIVYEKNTANGRLQLNGAGNYMRQVANAKADGVNYDLSIMTCHGTSLGNGDATHRYVIFANKI